MALSTITISSVFGIFILFQFWVIKHAKAAPREADAPFTPAPKIAAEIQPTPTPKTEPVMQPPIAPWMIPRTSASTIRLVQGCLCLGFDELI